MILIFRVPLLLSLLVCSVVAKPAGKKNENFSPQELAVLKEFITAKNNRDWDKTFSLMIKNERKLLMGHGSTYPYGVLRRISALKLKDLSNNSEIRIENGKIIGLYKIFQTHHLKENPGGRLILEISPPNTIKDDKDSRDEENESEDEVTEVDSESRDSHQKKIDEVFALFLMEIDNEKYRKALALVDQDELDLILGFEDELTENTKLYLKQVDRKSSTLLELENGKLQNLFLLLPINQKSLELALGVFINHVKQNNWPKAMKMLTRYERNYLTGKDDKIKPEYAEKLKKLTLSDYKSFYLFDDRLSGVLQWMGLGVYGQPVKGKK